MELSSKLEFKFGGGGDKFTDLLIVANSVESLNLAVAHFVLLFLGNWTRSQFTTKDGTATHFSLIFHFNTLIESKQMAMQSRGQALQRCLS